MLTNTSKQTYLLYITFLILLVGIITTTLTCHSCKNEKHKTNIVSDSTIYSKNNFSNSFIDVHQLENFYAADSCSLFIKENISDFYNRRDYQLAWFDNYELSEAAAVFKNLIESNYAIPEKSRIQLINQIKFADSIKLDSQFLNNHIVDIPYFEFLLSKTYFQYANLSYDGTVKELKDLEWYIPRKKKNLQLLLEKISCCDKDLEKFEPVNKYFKSLKNELLHYRDLKNQFPWEPIRFNRIPLFLTTEDSIIPLVKQRLRLFGDYTSKDSTLIFTDTLEIAIKKFQARNGIKENGVLDKSTCFLLNKPIQEWIKTILLNMERLRWLPDTIPPNMILVNIPEFKLHIFENDTLAWDMNVVVGKEGNATNIFAGNLSTVVFNPYWSIPQSIIANEILPKLKVNPNYLNKNNMELLDSKSNIVNPYSINWDSYSKGIPYTIRQKPGAQNALGKVKFLFPNSYSIYLHDTPSKNLFEREKRAFSHGCIRLGEPIRFANYILETDSSSLVNYVNKILATEKETSISLKKPRPVFITYFTAWVDSKNILNFRPDVYKHDLKLEKTIFTD